MSNLSVGQLIMDAQRMASRVKDLDTLGTALMVEAESNNRVVESLRQFQDDMDSLNRISNNKTNAEMVNRIQQQNANSSEILKENRELKICIEDYERALELIMQKYREHTGAKIVETKINMKEIYNEKLLHIIYQQREKINEMAAVMHRAASIDDEAHNYDLQMITSLRLENKTLRELLQISQQFGTSSFPIRLNEHMLSEKSVQTDLAETTLEDSADELSISGASVENINNNSVIHLYESSITTDTTAIPSDISLPDNAALLLQTGIDNNNGPNPEIITNASSTQSQTQSEVLLKVKADRDETKCNSMDFTTMNNKDGIATKTTINASEVTSTDITTKPAATTTTAAAT